jgi:tRNA uridine 5-carboxymethylaminomethyl modification enzyme
MQLVDDARWKLFNKKRDAVTAEQARLSGIIVQPKSMNDSDQVAIGVELQKEVVAVDLLRRPELSYEKISKLAVVGAFDEDGPVFDELREQIVLQLDVQAKYQGYIERQAREIGRQEKQESLRLPADIDYDSVDGLSNEARQRLARTRPVTLGQASRLEGMTPSAVSLILIHLKKRQLKKSA